MKDEKMDQKEAYFESKIAEIRDKNTTTLDSVPSAEAYKKMLKTLYPRIENDHKPDVCHDFVEVGTDEQIVTLRCRDCGFIMKMPIVEYNQMESEKGMKR